MATYHGHKWRSLSSGLCSIALLVPMFLSAAAVNAAVIEIVPVRASGVEGVDWNVSGNEIYLSQGGQDVEVHVRVRAFGSDQVATYQTTLDCDTFDSDVSGKALAISTDCSIGQGTFGVDFCLGVDESEDTYILANANATLPACQSNVPCPNGDPGAYSCGAVSILGDSGPDNGGSYYASTYAFSISNDFDGTIAIGLDSDPSVTALIEASGKPIAIDAIEPALITLSTCTNDSQCNDNNMCTTDVCVNGLCDVTYDYDVNTFCCNPTDGKLALIDDSNSCTDDVCDFETGVVLHIVPPSSDMCSDGVGSRGLAVTPPCGTSGECDNETFVGILVSIFHDFGEGPVSLDVGYVQHDGSLAETIVYDTPLGWGTVELLPSGIIRPETVYTFTLIPESPTAAANSNINLGSQSTAKTDHFADIDGNGVCNLEDALLAILAFQGNEIVDRKLADMDCVPNNIINLADVFAVVRCFTGQDFTESTPTHPEPACALGVCCAFPETNPCGSCDSGYLLLTELGYMESDCTEAPISGVWTEGVDSCGPDDQCPGLCD